MGDNGNGNGNTRNATSKMPWLAAIFALGVAAALIVVQLVNDGGKPDTTTLGLFVLGLLLLFIVIAPSAAAEALGRISKLKLGALEFGLKEIKRAERVRPVPGEGDGVPAPRESDCGYAEIVELLHGRLRFAREILEFEGDVSGEDDYRDIAAWLREHALLKQDDEAFVLDLLEGTGVDVAEWDRATREDFLDAAYAFSFRFGSMIWDRRVRGELRRHGWFLTDYEQPSGHRPDFLAYREGRWALFTARVGGAEPGHAEKAGGRLVNFKPRPLINSRAIVIPDIRHGQVGEELAWSSARPDGVRMIRLGELNREPNLPFAVPADDG